MQFDAPILLYGAGLEARSTREYLAQTAPKLTVFVTNDSGETAIPNTVFLPVGELETAITSGKFGTIVKSPGVPLYKPIFAFAREHGVTVTSNLNLWGAAFAKTSKTIVITGTKGKSTTATLTHLMLRAAGLDAILGGNVGVAPLDIGGNHAITVLELSSYQTADIDWQPDLVGLTNLYPEHLDWHGSTERYFNDKLHLLSINPDAALALAPQAAALPITQDAIGDIARVLTPLSEELDEALMRTAQQSRLKGQHNIENARLAAQLSLAAGAGPDAVLQGIKDFAPLPHRLEEHTIAGLVFVDDSISTTPEATKAALNAYFGHKIALLAGGFDRGQDYAELAQLIGQQNIALVICLPKTGDRLAQALTQSAPHVLCLMADTLEEAMKKLQLRRNQFDTAILSPAAPSYNQFKNFQERGAAFISLANQKFV